MATHTHWSEQVPVAESSLSPSDWVIATYMKLPVMFRAVDAVVTTRRVRMSPERTTIHYSCNLIAAGRHRAAPRLPRFTRDGDRAQHASDELLTSYNVTAFAATCFRIERDAAFYDVI